MKDIRVVSADLKPVYKWILWVLGTLLVLLIIAQIIISLFGDEYAAQKLKQQISSSTDSTYTLTFDDLDVNVFGRSITLKNLRLTADTSAFSQAPTDQGKPPSSLFKGRIQKLKITGISILPAIRGQALEAGHIEVDQPDITMWKNPHPVAPDSGHSFSSIDSSIYAAISNRYTSLKIGSIGVKNAHLRAVKYRDTLASVQRLVLKLRKIMVDSATAQSGRKFVTSHITTDIRKVKVNLPSGLSTFKFGRLRMSSSKKSIQVDSLHVKPRYPRGQFASHRGVQTDRIDLMIPRIAFHAVDFPQYVDSSRFHVPFVEINTPTLHDFHDKTLSFPSGQRPPLPNVALLNLKQKLKVDSIRVKNGLISYSEYHAGTPKAGKVTFEKLNATLRNITNYDKAIRNGESATMDAQTMVMGTGLLKTHFDFPLDTKNGFHKVSGTLGSMKLTDFNRILKYVAFARVNSGQLDHMKFDMTLNKVSSSGTLIMKYEELNVALLKKGSMQNEGLFNKIKTFAANKLIINDSNTPEDGMQAGKIEFKRIQKKGVFNYWWKSLLSGIKKSIK